MTYAQQPDDGGLGLPPSVIAAIDRVIALQRPVVLLHIRRIRARRPNATPDEIVRSLERRYLTAVTSGGAAVGAVAIIPAIGTGTGLAISAAETVGFLEATALFAQSVTEVHGIALNDPDRARALVLALLIGGPSQELIRQVSKQATGGSTRSAFWGEQITRSLPIAVVGEIANHIRRRYLPKLVVTGTGGIVGRVLPFGIGAVVGGVGNQLYGRTIVRAAREAFGPMPIGFPPELAVVVSSKRLGGAVRTPTSALGRGFKSVGSPKPRKAITRGPATKPATGPPPPDEQTRRPGPPPH